MMDNIALRERLLSCIRTSPPDSIQDLSKEIGLSAMTISNFLKGKRLNIDIKSYLKIENWVIGKEVATERAFNDDFYEKKN